jgi:hypothetical protein
MSSRSATALGKLRLHIDDVGFGEPADQVDVMDGKIDHDADIRHARRERPHARDRNREDLLVLDRLLDRGDGRIETLDMADHQRHTGSTRGGHDLVAFIDGGRDRLLDEDVNFSRDAGERHIAMKMRRRGDGHRIGTGIEHLLEGREGRAADDLGCARAMSRKRIDDPDEFNTGQTGKNTGMVGAHDPRADDANAQRAATIIGIHN